MNDKVKSWGERTLSEAVLDVDGRVIQHEVTIAQSRIVQDGSGGYVTQVTLTSKNDGKEMSGWHTVDGTNAPTRQDAEQQQCNALYDTPIEEMIVEEPTVITPVLNPDGSPDREATFREAQQAQETAEVGGSDD